MLAASRSSSSTMLRPNSAMSGAVDSPPVTRDGWKRWYQRVLTSVDLDLSSGVHDVGHLAEEGEAALATGVGGGVDAPRVGRERRDEDLPARGDPPEVAVAQLVHAAAEPTGQRHQDEEEADAPGEERQLGAEEVLGAVHVRGAEQRAGHRA